MIDTNRGVKSWGGQPQTDRGLTDTVQQIGADAKQKAFGDKDIGTVLNEITDPNFVDTSKKPRGVGNTELNKDAFFKLMMAQLKNQNPLQPMESHEMAANLAQFTALEQLFNVNENLDSLKKNQEPNANYQLMSFVGKTVTADSSQIQRGKGDTIHDLKFQLPANAEEVKITVEDASGQVVRSSTQKSLKAGENKFSWNGIQDDGQTARAGDYNVKFEAKDSSGKNIAIQSRFTGRITGLNFSSQGPVLMMGNQSIRLADIKKVEEISGGAQAPAEGAAQAGAQANGTGVGTPSPMIPSAASNASMQAALAGLMARAEGKIAAGSAGTAAASPGVAATSGATNAPQTARSAPQAPSSTEVPPGPPADARLVSKLDDAAIGNPKQTAMAIGSKQ